MNIILRIWNLVKGTNYNIRLLKNLNINLHELLTEKTINEQLYDSPKYQNSKKLNKHEFQVYSQNGEDGILEEIFRRIGTTNKFFVEFGAGNGLENNTTYLLLKNWSGYWMDANEKCIQVMKQKFGFLIERKKLFVKKAFINAENIEDLLIEGVVPENFDLLSIDIDGNDYWVWRAIKTYNPRVVVIEYNALFPPNVKWVMKYNPKHVWDITCYHGASLKSLEILGVKKGYKLVGCNFTGVNAFFIREDLVEDRFFKPFTAENHYEPPRYHLQRKIGHSRNFGEFEIC